MRLPALVLVALAVAACGTAPKAPPPAKPAYYADDGPPDSVPVDIAAIPDAVPRDEPYHRYANRPYTVFGRSYAPMVSDDPLRERGLASWYGRKFHGQKTSSGEVYDMFAMTAAHKTLPIPSYVRVTSAANGRSVVVRVNDRGPFHDGRIIDLSYAAAAKLGIANPGSGLVEVERVFARDATRLAAADVPQPRPAEVATALVAPGPSGLYLQLGAFSSAENAEAFRDRVARELTWLNEPLEVAAAGSLHRVRLGPYRTRDEAQAIADKIRASLDLAPVITPATR
jgi:rare lipoprotein A